MLVSKTRGKTQEICPMREKREKKFLYYTLCCVKTRASCVFAHKPYQNANPTQCNMGFNLYLPLRKPLSHCSNDMLQCDCIVYNWCLPNNNVTSSGRPGGYPEDDFRRKKKKKKKSTSPDVLLYRPGNAHIGSRRGSGRQGSADGRGLILSGMACPSTFYETLLEVFTDYYMTSASAYCVTANSTSCVNSQRSASMKVWSSDLDKGLVTNYGEGGGATKREGGGSTWSFTPTKRGGQKKF